MLRTSLASRLAAGVLVEMLTLAPVALGTYPAAADIAPLPVLAIEYRQRYRGYPQDLWWHWPHRHFQPHEFASKGNGYVDIEKRLVVALDRVRRDFGAPIRILSGYRDPRHNRRVGGARNSQHLYGTAVDLDLRRYGWHDRYRLTWYLIAHGFTSFGTYGHSPHMLHADMRTHAVTWHHGRRHHPGWLTQAMRDTGWRQGRGGKVRR